MSDTTQQELQELDDLIIQEKMQIAMEHQSNTWAECAAEGIEPQIVADAALEVIIQETVNIYGEEMAETLLDSLKCRILSGEFSPLRTLQ